MHNIVLILSIILAVVISAIAFRYLELKDALTILVLVLTAIALVWTVYDARQDSEIKRLADLRPVILRDGKIPDWSILQTEVEKESWIQNFHVENNIVTNVSGYVVIKNKKYRLSFDLTQPTDSKYHFLAPTSVGRESRVGWVEPGGLIIGATFPDKYEQTSEKEGFCLLYSDIEGNGYQTFEDSRQVPISKAATSKRCSAETNT